MDIKFNSECDKVKIIKYTDDKRANVNISGDNRASAIRQKTFFMILKLLNTIIGERKYPDQLIGDLFRKEEFQLDEKATVVEIVYGVLRNMGRIDHIIEHASSAVIPGIQLNVLNILRICTYQAVFKETSQAGIINNAVALASSCEKGRFTGFVKRTVEAILRNKQDVSFPDREENPLEYICIYHSHPKWIVEKWSGEFEDTNFVEALCRSNNLEPPLTIRANPLKTDRDKLKELLKEEGFDSSLASFSPFGLVVDKRGDIFKTRAFRKGLFDVQDEGSQLITLLAAKGEFIIDACAGNGGKSLFLSGLMKNRGNILAFETHGGKLANLRRRAGRAGATNIKTTADLQELEKYSGTSDCVFIDAPCSGMGVFRRNPDAKWRLTGKDILELAGKQKDLLWKYSQLVRPGGRLVYATCTISREENEDVVQDFLEENKDFHIISASEANPDILSRFTTKEDFFKSFPHLHNTDGFFGAVMQRALFRT